MTEPLTTRPSWRDDPADPARDRWWDGEGWSTISVKKSALAMFGLEYERAMRTRSNPFARLAQLFSYTSAGLTLAALTGVVIALATAVRTSPPTGSPLAIPILVLVGAALITAVTSWILSIVALCVSRRRGAFVPALWSVISGAILIVVLIVIVNFFMTVAPTLVP